MGRAGHARRPPGSGGVWCGLRSFVRVENPPLDSVRRNPVIDNTVKAIDVKSVEICGEGFIPVPNCALQ